MMQFDGRRVLLVGSGGIGSAVAQRLAADGAAIFATYASNPQSAKHLGMKLPAGSLAGAARLDATDLESIGQVAGAQGLAASALGGIDTLVITTGHRHELNFLANTEPTLLEEIVHTELIAPMLLLRAVVPQMVDAGFGRVVLVGSDSGKAGTMADPASSAARAGLAGLARSVARETSRVDVTVNVVSPGPTDTQLLDSMLQGQSLTAKIMGGTLKAVPKGRAARPEEVAAAVAYLASKDAGFTTGQVISVSGGLTM